MGSKLQLPDTSGAMAEYSRYVQRIRRRYAADLATLPPGLPDAAAITALVLRLQAGGRALPSALRVARQLVLERLVVLDIEQAAPLAHITHTMTALAEATLELALAAARAEEDARCGPPLDATGLVIDFWIIGMGKLGARELNVSSDIDLIYVYEDAGDTTGPVKISAHEYFANVAKRLYTLIGDTTDDGFVFRVDLALRPNGNSGPPVVSMAMLEEYFQVQGREWERFAWLKSRVVAPAASVASGRALPLRSLVSVFISPRAASLCRLFCVLRLRISGNCPPRTTNNSCTMNSISRMPPRESLTSFARSGRPAARRWASSRILRCSWRRPSKMP